MPQNQYVVRSSVQVYSGKGKGKAAVAHAVKTYRGSEGIDTRMLNLGTGRRWSGEPHASITLPAGKALSVPVDCVGPRTNLDVLGK